MGKQFKRTRAKFKVLNSQQEVPPWSVARQEVREDPGRDLAGGGAHAGVSSPQLLTNRYENILSLIHI